MATVESYTKVGIENLIGDLFKGARIESGELILTTFDDEDVNVGSVSGDFLSAETLLSDPTSDTWAEFTIDDDGSPTAGWPDRFQVSYIPDGSITPRNTFWLNEYGEFRGMPAKQNTVGARVFAALDSTDYAARSSSIPVFEVVNTRNGTRVTRFGVLKDGSILRGARIHGTVLTLESAEDESDIPADTPPGTLILRKV